MTEPARLPAAAVELRAVDPNLTAAERARLGRAAELVRSPARRRRCAGAAPAVGTVGETPGRSAGSTAAG